VTELKSSIKRQEAVIVKYKDDTTDPIEFVDKCSSLMTLKKFHRNWIRKIEIAELEGKKARALLKKHGQVWHDEPTDEE